MYFSSFGFKAKHQYPYSLRTTTYYEDPDDCLEYDTKAECSSNPKCEWKETLCMNYNLFLEENIISDDSYQLESSGDSYPKSMNFKLGIEHYLNPSTILAFDITQINHRGKKQ